jgi:succinate-semialdehyde dehydrogenase / glutarate-semialdehyde dehydrogenase
LLFYRFIERIEHIDDIVERAKALPFGLAGYVWSRSLPLRRRAASALEVGMPE